MDPFNPKDNDIDDAKLNTIINHLIIAHISFIMTIMIGSYILKTIMIIFAVPILAFYALYTRKTTQFETHLCPNCKENFFQKNLYAISLSAYVKKCCHCGYKLKKA